MCLGGVEVFAAEAVDLAVEQSGREPDVVSPVEGVTDGSCRPRSARLRRAGLIVAPRSCIARL